MDIIREYLTSILIATIISGLFIGSAIFRIRNAVIVLRNKEISKTIKIKNKLDIICSSIFLFGSLVTYMIFIFNVGR
jgi:uncharacterized membrane protein HdeD (DUF308 family)